jgi:hypothetical protein
MASVLSTPCPPLTTGAGGPAADPVHRHGILLLNDGGPGVGMPLEVATVEPAVTVSYDLTG